MAAIANALIKVKVRVKATKRNQFGRVDIVVFSSFECVRLLNFSTLVSDKSAGGMWGLSVVSQQIL
jgi:hypothetical protein